MLARRKGEVLLDQERCCLAPLVVDLEYERVFGPRRLTFDLHMDQNVKTKERSQPCVKRRHEHRQKACHCGSGFCFEGTTRPRRGYL